MNSNIIEQRAQFGIIRDEYMAPLPKHKWSRKRQGTRRATIKLTIPDLVTCPNCGGLKKAHQVCPSCGQYNNRQIIVKKEKKKKESTK